MEHLLWTMERLWLEPGQLRLELEPPEFQPKPFQVATWTSRAQRKRLWLEREALCFERQSLRLEPALLWLEPELL
jgi:hypothetical protein